MLYKMCKFLVPLLMTASISCVSVPPALSKAVANTKTEVETSEKNYVSLLEVLTNEVFKKGQDSAQKIFNAQLENLLNENRAGSPLFVLKGELSTILTSDKSESDKKDLILQAYHKCQDDTNKITMTVFSQYNTAVEGLRKEIDTFRASALSETAHQNAMKYLDRIKEYTDALTDYSNNTNKLLELLPNNLEKSIPGFSSITSIPSSSPNK